MRHVPRVSWVICTLLLSSSLTWGHGGGLDSYGCHHNRKAGGYHCHRGALAGQSFATQVEAIRALKASRPPEQQDQPLFTGGNPAATVWVNTPSGVYHCRGTRWYGATKQGTYMKQKDAQQKGNRPAYGRYCS
jgi:hypothetical protein